MEFFALIGVVAVFFFLKFIWDTEFSPKAGAAKRIEQKRHSAEFAKTFIECSQPMYLQNVRVPTSISNKDMSLQLLASHFGCEILEAKERYLEGIFKMVKEMKASNTQTISVLNTALTDIKENKAAEAQQFTIHPDDTPAAWTEQWLAEFITLITEKQNQLVAQHSAVAASRTPSKMELQDIEPLDEPSSTNSTSRVTIHEIQKYADGYKVTVQQSHNGTKRRVSLLLSEEVVLGGGKNKGLRVGKEVSGYCINMLTSSQPFFDGQQPHVITGLYRKAVFEPAVPGQGVTDRNIS